MAHKDIYRYFREDYAGHSKANAYLLALLSHYVYKEKLPGSGAFESRFKNLFQDLSDTDPFVVQTFTESLPFPYDTEVAILANSRVVLVVFRGTEGVTAIKDWITNSKHLMMDAPDDWGDVKLHKGFYNALSQVYQSVRSEVRSRRTNNQKVFLTGHSLGGALATICAYRFQKVGGVPVAGVYVFGAPRVGDIGFANAYNNLLKDKTFRWVKNLDFASTLPDYAPPPLPTTRYHHVGSLNFIKANGAIEVDHLDVEPIGIPSIADHDMRNYCITMYSRLSKDKRQSDSNPAYLVQSDVPASGLFG
ncbi:MAG: lipase family protein [Anaerolineae bacterium]|nr:lipase family protein [Anaerolineae bacterium]